MRSHCSCFMVRHYYKQSRTFHILSSYAVVTKSVLLENTVEKQKTDGNTYSCATVFLMKDLSLESLEVELNSYSDGMTAPAFMSLICAQVRPPQKSG